MENLIQAPLPRKERKVPYLTLYFPATSSIAIYRLEAAGMRLIRCLTGVMQQPGAPATIHQVEPPA